jgi:hypothetical protein
MTQTARLVDEAVFELVAGLEIQKSLRLQYPLSLLTIRAEATEAAANPRLTAHLTRVLSTVIRGTDLVAADPTPTGAVLHLLLIDAPHEHVPGVVRRIEEEMSLHRFPADGGFVAVCLRTGAATFPTTATTLDDLRAQAEWRAAERCGGIPS